MKNIAQKQTGSSPLPVFAGSALHGADAAGRVNRPALVGRIIIVGALVALVAVIRVIHLNLNPDAIAADGAVSSSQPARAGASAEGGLQKGGS